MGLRGNVDMNKDQEPEKKTAGSAKAEKDQSDEVSKTSADPVKKSAAESKAPEKKPEQPAASAEAAEKPAEKPIRKKPSFFQSVKFKHGSTATAFTAGFIAVMVLLNVVVGILGDRFPSLNLDVTKSGSNTLSSDTVSMIDKVKIPINITICATKAACENGAAFQRRRLCSGEPPLF